MLPMIELNSHQRKLLEKYAQSLSPDALIGGAGVTDEQIKHIEMAIAAHELIKVKFNEFKEDKQELSQKIADETNSTLVRIIGNVASFYRAAKDPAKQKYTKELNKLAK